MAFLEGAAIDRVRFATGVVEVSHRIDILKSKCLHLPMASPTDRKAYPTHSAG